MEKITSIHKTRTKTDFLSFSIGVGAGGYVAIEGYDFLEQNQTLDNVQTSIVGRERMEESFLTMPITNNDALDVACALPFAVAASIIANRVAANLMGNRVTVTTQKPTP